MKKGWLIWVMFGLGVLFTPYAQGQRINFGTWIASENISITTGSPSTLDFGQLFPGIGSDEETISLLDNRTAVFIISAPQGYDLNVWFDIPTELVNESNSSATIPFEFSFAYSNLGYDNTNLAKQTAIQVPSGFSSATFPIVRRNSGPPAAAPPPPSQAYTAPIKTAYLFIYGHVGPVVAGTAQGNYSATITINIDFASNE